MATVNLLSYWANPSAAFRLSSREIARKVTQAVPWNERAMAVLFREFLQSDLTVKDMQHRLGLRRPGLVTKMFFEPKRADLRTGAWMDALEDALDVILEVKVVPRSDADLRVMCKVMGEWPESLTPDEHQWFTSLVEGRQTLPSNHAIEQFAAQRENPLAIRRGLG